MPDPRRRDVHAAAEKRDEHEEPRRAREEDVVHERQTAAAQTEERDEEADEAPVRFRVLERRVVRPERGGQGGGASGAERPRGERRERARPRRPPLDRRGHHEVPGRLQRATERERRSRAVRVEEHPAEHGEEGAEVRGGADRVGGLLREIEILLQQRGVHGEQVQRPGRQHDELAQRQREPLRRVDGLHVAPGRLGHGRRAGRSARGSGAVCNNSLPQFPVYDSERKNPRDGSSPASR
eukprot:31139-Pelagococcus_subviridis.AAC.3